LRRPRPQIEIDEIGQPKAKKGIKKFENNKAQLKIIHDWGIIYAVKFDL